MTGETILITGCSQSGLAPAMVKAFVARGFIVLATLRDLSKAGDLAKTDDVEILELDVTSQDSIGKSVKAVEKLTGGQLYGLVNNAGIMDVMPLLDSSIDEAKRIYDTNVWGMLRMSQAFAPMLIKANGFICNISSVSGELTYAWTGIYGSSKLANKLISETLRIEMEPLGVRVVTVILGGVSTAQNDPKNRPDLELPPDSYYGKIWSEINRHKKGLVFDKKHDVHVTAKNIVSDVLDTRKYMIRRGEGSSMSWLGNSFIPYGVFTDIVNRDSGLKSLKG